MRVWRGWPGVLLLALAPSATCCVAGAQEYAVLETAARSGVVLPWPTEREAEQLPESPTPQTGVSQSAAAPGEPVAVLPTVVIPGRITDEALTVHEKWDLYSRDTFGPRALVLPSIGAAFRLINPPDRYSEEWKGGIKAFGREYGNSLAIDGSRNTAYFAVGVLDREDPRYAAAGSRNFVIRLSHALAYTFVAKADSGRNRFALSNFAGSIAGGFIGNAYMPAGYRDITHAGQRSLRQLSEYAGNNIVREFQPELLHLLHWLHIPAEPIPIPVWWTRGK